METPIWKSKEIKGLFIILLGENPDGTVKLSFQVNKRVPTRTHNYTKDYLQTFFEYHDKMTWSYKFL